MQGVSFAVQTADALLLAIRKRLCPWRNFTLHLVCELSGCPWGKIEFSCTAGGYVESLCKRTIEERPFRKVPRSQEAS
ncbi:hypothetical protein KM043_015153 [Ampulex compressa]|nr:hypothetical protein KM043_015153 [Ampulex compressa]